MPVETTLETTDFVFRSFGRTPMEALEAMQMGLKQFQLDPELAHQATLVPPENTYGTAIP